MAIRKKLPAPKAAQKRGSNRFWLDHAYFSESDLEWLGDVEALTLWNVDMPGEFLSKLPKLWWLDIRGGSHHDLGLASNCDKLRYLNINQVRGITDLSYLCELDSLEYISLYGLPKVENIPSFKRLSSLKRLDLGMLKGLESLENLLDAPSLREILLLKKINVTPNDIKRIQTHPSLAFFEWIPIDVPKKEWAPVKESIKLTTTESLHPERWFASVPDDWL